MTYAGIAQGHAQAAPLADGEVVDALVPADLGAVLQDDRAGPGGCVGGMIGDGLVDEPGVVAVGDEADLLALLLVGHGQADFGGEGPHLLLGEVAEREDDVPELVLLQVEKEIGLVLVEVAAARQQVTVVASSKWQPA